MQLCASKNFADLSSRVAEMYASGKSLAQTASCVGMSVATVTRWLDLMGIPKREGGSGTRGKSWSERRRAHNPTRKQRIPVDRRAKGIERFHAFVSAPNERGCMEWSGYLLPSGYGRIKIDGTSYLAHRLAWELRNGAIPDTRGHHGTLSVCHRCDNPKCCNPAHLFLGTHRDNMADMRSKGRGNKTAPRPKRGTENPGAKLTSADVQAIRDARAVGVTTVELGRRFHVHSSVISRAARGVTY